MSRIDITKINDFIDKHSKEEYVSYLYNDILHYDKNLKNMLNLDNLSTTQIIETSKSNKEYECNKIIYNIATEFITDEFFKDENKENIFKFQYLINESFNKMTIKIIDMINDYIKQNIKLQNPRVKFLEYTDIIFIYKGGTTLKILFDKYVNVYANTNNTEFFESLKNNFKRSDSDYVIMINPNISLERNGVSFAYVYKLVNKHVSDMLYNIGMFIYNDGITDHNILKKPIDIRNIDLFITKLQNSIDKLKENRANVLCEKYYNCKEVIGIGYLDNEIIVKPIREMDRNLFNNVIEKLKSDFIVITKVNNDTIVGKPKGELQEKINKNYSDITFSINDSIESIVRDDIISSFCLQRLKINFVVYFINNKNEIDYFECPGELIDIVILKQDSFNLRSFYEHMDTEYSRYIYKISDYELIYNSYTLYGHIQDLLYILFIYSKYPWDDQKYDKRLYRLLLLIIFEHIKNNNNNDDLQKVIYQYRDLFKYLINKNMDEYKTEFQIDDSDNKMNKYLLNNLYNLYTYPEINNENNEKKLLEMLTKCLEIFNKFNPDNIYNTDTLERSIEFLNLEGNRVKQLGGKDKNVNYKQKYLKYKKKYMDLKKTEKYN